MFFLLALPVMALALGPQESPVPIELEQTQWVSVPNLSGLQVAWAIGSEEGAGLYVLRVKLEADARIPVHTHPDERISTVLSGTLYVGFGDQFDEKSLVKIVEGACYVAPAGVAHFVWAKDGEVVYQEMGSGPTATKVNVKPKK